MPSRSTRSRHRSIKYSAHHRQAAARQGPRRLPVPRARPSTKRSCVTSPAADLIRPSSATPCWLSGTGTGKTHVAIAIAKKLQLRSGSRGRFALQRGRSRQPALRSRPVTKSKVGSPINSLEWTSSFSTNLGYLPLLLNPEGSFLFHLVSRLYERTSIYRHHNEPRIRWNVAERSSVIRR